MSLKPSLARLIATCLLLQASSALAADYDPPIFVDDAPEYTPVEVGSGWYLRGDIGASVNHPFEHSESGDFDTGEFDEDSTLLTGGIGIGYHINDYLRTEVNFGILPSSEFSREFLTTCSGLETVTITDPDDGVTSDTNPSTRPCEGSDESSNKSYSLLANAYLDLGTYVGFTPYIGGGAGVVYSKLRSADGDLDCQDSSTSSTAGGTTTDVSFNCYDSDVYEGSVTSDGQYEFAYALGAGLAYKVSDNVSLDLNYQYLNVPSARYVDVEDGNVVFKEGVDHHQVRVGLRYDLW